MDLVNRYALVVRSAQPMIDWVRKVDIDMDREPVSEDRIRAASNVYLIPAFDPPSAAENYLKKRVKEIFEAEVGAWYTDPDLWPKQLGWKTFGKWFEWEIHEMLWDLEAGPLVKDSYGDDAQAEFDFHEDFFDEYDEFDYDRAAEWVEELYDEFSDSPEAAEFRKAHRQPGIGWTTSFFDYIHDYEWKPIHNASAADLEFALMRHFPRKVMDPDLDAPAVIGEFRALFEFLRREYAFERADAFLEFLQTPGLAEDFDAAMNDESAFGMAKSFFAGGGDVLDMLPPAPRGFSPLAAQTPFTDSSPDVGRNDPCPCGSGKKYKKCCLRKG